jgi:diguanylate cyclase (GGDEF)-like protein
MWDTPGSPARARAPRLLASLRARVCLLVLVTIGGFAALVITYSHHQLSRADAESARAKVSAEAHAMDAVFEADDLSRPAALLRHLDALASGDPELASASVYSVVDGSVTRLATSDRALVGRPVDPAVSGPLASGRSVYTAGDVGARLVSPLRDRAGRTVAVLDLRLDLRPRDAALARRTRDIALVALSLSAVVAGLVLLLLGRWIAGPVERLAEAARAIADGRLSARAGWARADEIGQLGAAFDRMAERLEAGYDEHRRLRRVAEAVAAEADPGRVMDLVAREVGEMLGADAAIVAGFDGEHERIEVVGRWRAEGVRGQVVDPRGAVERTRTTGRTARVGRGGPGGWERVSVAAPIRVAGELWGAVGAVSVSRRWEEADAARLEDFSEMVSLAVANAAARRKLMERARTDSLTGLVNHRAFQETLAEEVGRARRHDRPLSLALIDLDHFKQVNDEHGHQAGDEVLRELARRLGERVREADVLARVGGEEFAWLMPESSGMEAWQAAERARAEIAATPIPGVGHVTISAGICDLGHAIDAGDLYRLADGALYWSKSQGRDVVFLYSPDVVEVLSDAEQAARLGRRQSLQSIRVLARAVDARDPHTREHSDRVGDIAVAIATALGWPLERSALLREAGMVHDVGKIAIPERSSSSRARRRRTSARWRRRTPPSARRWSATCSARSRWPGCAATTSAGTAAATRTASPGSGSRRAPASSASPTPGT